MGILAQETTGENARLEKDAQALAKAV